MSVDTICALATAPGGAIGIVRISGNETLEILSRVFTKDLTNAQPNTIHYGHIRRVEFYSPPHLLLIVLLQELPVEIVGN